jgi:SAM-dependent methyltransferase
MSAILDVGCGNGTLARALQSLAYQGRYLGIDLSAGLLESAQKTVDRAGPDNYTFQQANLTDPDWADPFTPAQFNAITCFAVLHHLPGADLRRRTAEIFHTLIEPQGFVAVSVWQWQNSTRLVKRVVPWSKVGLNPKELDEGDVLLDWRAAEQVGLRYVHTFSERSLTLLAERSGFTVRESFLSDGKPGNLALYQIWQPVQN